MAAEDKEKQQEAQSAAPAKDTVVAAAATDNTAAGKAVPQKSDSTAKSATQKGLAISADAKIQKDRAEILSQNTVTISVAWTGGGQDLKASKLITAFNEAADKEADDH